MKAVSATIFAAALMLPPVANAEIFRCMDAAGNITYSLTRPTTACHVRKGAAQTRLVANNSPADFPRVDAATQLARDDRRRQILEAELAEEERLFASAREDAAAHHERNIIDLRKALSTLRPQS